MRLNANHLTIMRIVLLPLPYFLIFQGNWQRVIALVTIALLGITDYLDGIMARKYGTTALGQLLDPIADKIFIAVLFLPLVYLKILPLWLVWLILLREFLVTELRRYTGQGTERLSVTELAKIKTSLQMTGGGLILITATFTSLKAPIYFLLVFLILSVGLALWLYKKNHRLPKRLKIFIFFVLLSMSIRLLFSWKDTCLIYALILLGVTLISGFQYVKTSLPICIKQGLLSITQLLLAIIPPMVVLYLLNFVPDLLNLVLLILCIEFGVQGLDLWAAHKGGNDISWIKRYIMLPIAAIIAVILYYKFNMILAAKAFIYVTSISLVIYSVIDVWINRNLFVQDPAPQLDGQKHIQPSSQDI